MIPYHTLIFTSRIQFTQQIDPPLRKKASKGSVKPKRIDLHKVKPKTIKAMR